MSDLILPTHMAKARKKEKIKVAEEGKTIEELEKAQNIDKDLLRFLTVKVKKHDLETNYFEKKEV